MTLVVYLFMVSAPFSLVLDRKNDFLIQIAIYLDVLEINILLEIESRKQYA